MIVLISRRNSTGDNGNGALVYIIYASVEAKPAAAPWLEGVKADETLVN